MDKIVIMNSSPPKDVINEVNVIEKKSTSRRSLTKSLDSLPSLRQTTSNGSLLSNDDYSKHNSNINNRNNRNSKSQNGNYYLSSTQINELSNFSANNNNNNNNNVNRKIKRMGRSGKLPNLVNPGLIIESAQLSIGKISNQKNKMKISGELITPTKNYNKNKSVYKYKLYPGNNPRLILGCLRKRTWWHAVPHPKTSATGIPYITDDKLAEELPQLPEVVPHFIWEMYRSAKKYKDDTYKDVVLNHIQGNNCLVSKKGLYFSIKSYCVKNNIDISTIVPRTYFIASASTEQQNLSDDLDEFLEFNKVELAKRNLIKNQSSIIEKETNNEVPEQQDENIDKIDVTTANDKKNKNKEIKEIKEDNGVVWILKPSSKTNRGFGICVERGVDATLAVVHKLANEDDKITRKDVTPGALSKAAARAGAKEGWIVQEYMERPLLISGRKFDIRCYVLLVLTPKGGLKGYFYEEAYIRTSVKKYTLNNLHDRECHLTNDAIQSKSKLYVREENKLDLPGFQESIDKDYPNSPNNVVSNIIIPEIKRLCAISIDAGCESLAKSDIKNSFELLGYDYMVDEQFRPVLIEVNSNPCLELACPILALLIPKMIENVVKRTLDVMCPPPLQAGRTKTCDQIVTEIENSPDQFTQIYGK